MIQRYGRLSHMLYLLGLKSEAKVVAQQGLGKVMQTWDFHEDEVQDAETTYPIDDVIDLESGRTMDESLDTQESVDETLKEKEERRREERREKAPISMEHAIFVRLTEFYYKAWDNCINGTLLRTEDIHRAGNIFKYYTSDLPRRGDRPRYIQSTGNAITPAFALEIINYAREEFLYSQDPRHMGQKVMTCFDDWVTAAYMVYLDYYSENIDPSVRKEMLEGISKRVEEVEPSEEEAGRVGDLLDKLQEKVEKERGRPWDEGSETMDDDRIRTRNRAEDTYHT